jgi:hypothetical protein
MINHIVCLLLAIGFGAMYAAPRARTSLACWFLCLGYLAIAMRLAAGNKTDCLLFVLGANLAYFIFARPLGIKKRDAAEDQKPRSIPVVADSQNFSIPIEVHCENSDTLIESLCCSPMLGRAGGYLKNVELQLTRAYRLREDARLRMYAIQADFSHNVFLSADIELAGNLPNQAEDARLRFYEASNDAMRRVLRLMDALENFSAEWQALDFSTDELKEELAGVAAEVTLKENGQATSDNPTGSPEMVGFYENIAHEYSRKAETLACEASILLAEMETLAGLLHEAHGLGELVLSTVNPRSES